MKEFKIECDNGNYYLINEALSIKGSDNFITRKYVNGSLVDTFIANNLRECFEEVALDIKTDEVLVQGSFN